MARIEYASMIKDIRGSVGNIVYTQWKGLPCARMAPTVFRYPWESVLNAKQRDETAKLVNAWNNNLTTAQRAAWETYAAYLETLTTIYDMIPAKKYPSGTMSGYNAFLLVNLLSRSIGFTAIIEDEPSAEEIPIAPTLVDCVGTSGPPRKITVSYTYDAVPTATTFVRIWARGKRFAHLLIAKTQDATDETDIEITDLNFYKGATLPIPRDIYQVQLDAVNEFGNCSPPSEIGETEMI
jgi:hypothetical protein